MTEAGDFEWNCPTCVLSELPFANSTRISLGSTVTSQDSHSNLSTSSIEDRCNQSTQTGVLKCLSINARSIVNKTIDLKAMLNSDDIGMVAITETILDNTILDIELVDTNYYFVFRKDRNRHGGGVMFIDKEGIPAVRRHNLETDCELLWVELSFTSTNVLVGVFYNPPNSNIDSITNLEHSLSFLHSSNPPVVTLCGDFNLPGITWNMINPTVSTNSGEATQMMDIVNELNLVQLVMEPTGEITFST